MERARISWIAVRAGVHIGECETSEPQGPILEISGDIAAAAGPGEAFVSRVVVDLVPGSGPQFADRGALRVRGLARDVSVLAASRC